MFGINLNLSTGITPFKKNASSVGFLVYDESLNKVASR